MENDIKFLQGATIFISGGTGSFGNALLDYLKDNKGHFIVYSRDESKQHDMYISRKEENISYIIGDVRDKEKLFNSMQRVDYVFHAAALKHVPVCEYNPMEAVNTNVIGSMNVINAALDCNVGKVLNISSDKAVSPINLYGATKLVGEKLFSDANVYGGCFASVRFGNLDGSKGSIGEKIRNGEKLKVTDPDMTRLFMEIKKAAKFCIEALEMMQGGEVFVPKNMVLKRIGDMIQDAEVVGRRPGEKKHEALFNEDDFCKLQERDTCYIIK